MLTEEKQDIWIAYCIKEIEFILKNYNTKNSKSNGFTNKVCQTLKEETICQEEEGDFIGSCGVFRA